MVCSLVVNAYYVCNIGVSKSYQAVGDALLDIGFVLLIPPGSVLWLLEIIGIEVPLRGRESFIRLNLWLWVYCVFFYTIVFYFILTLLRKRKLTQNRI
jgi:hypothetical protein